MVRKHRAPKGALRRAALTAVPVAAGASQKAPSAKRCIKTRHSLRRKRNTIACQKAPSAKRCIKTLWPRARTATLPCQKAPSAKRCIKTRRKRRGRICRCFVRKHRAPKGALRQAPTHQPLVVGRAGQKAPSAKRCIKTHDRAHHPSKKCHPSESTERQKVH